MIRTTSIFHKYLDKGYRNFKTLHYHELIHWEECCVQHSYRGPWHNLQYFSFVESKEHHYYFAGWTICWCGLTSITLLHILFTPPWNTALYRTDWSPLRRRESIGPCYSVIIMCLTWRYLVVSPRIWSQSPGPRTYTATPPVCSPRAWSWPG